MDAPAGSCGPTFPVFGMNIPLPWCAECIGTVRGGCAPMPMSNGAPLPATVHFVVLRIPAWYLFLNASAESACSEAVGATEAGTSPHAENSQRDNKKVPAAWQASTASSHIVGDG